MDLPTPTDDIEVESSGVAPVEQVAPVAPATPVGDEPTEAEGVEAVSDGTDETPEPQKKDRRSLQAKIDAQTAKQRQAERERDEYRTRLEALERSAKPAATPEKKEPQYTRPKPTEAEIGSKYETYPDYIEALTDWKLEQRDATQRIEAQQRAVAERHQAHAAKFSEQIATAEEADPQWWSKIAPHVANLSPSSALSPGERPTAMHAIADVVFASEFATDLMLHLSANPKEFQRLSTLPPNDLFREMGRLEGSFSRPAAAPSGPAPKTPIISQAPAPIKPVGTAASTGEVDPLSEDLDVDTHIRVMNARDRKARR